MSFHVDGQLAWGYWLRLEKRHDGFVFLDPTGGEWRTIREDFFEARLRMRTPHWLTAGTMLERLLAVLISIGRGRPTADPAFLDLFEQRRDLAIH